MKRFQLVSRSAGDTRAIAAVFSRYTRAGDMIVLDGELGAGKTCFVQGFAGARGCAGSVTSPTFSIANFYRTTAGEILHVDLYRIETPGELEALGLEEYFPGATTLVEWGLKFPGYLDNFLLVSFARGEDDSRVLTVESDGGTRDALLETLGNHLSSFSPC